MVYLWVHYTIHSIFVFIDMFQNERKREISLSTFYSLFFLSRDRDRGFPGSPVVRTPSFPDSPVVQW